MVAGRYDVGGDVTLRTTLEGAFPSEGELREKEREKKRYFFVGERGLEEGSERSGIDLAMMTSYREGTLERDARDSAIGGGEYRFSRSCTERETTI